MKFYEELSNVYDIVFPENENTVEFLSKDLMEDSKIMDLACGTGTYSIALGKQGHEVTGIDLDKKMIEIANTKIKNFNVKFIEGDIRNSLKGEKYDRIFCIGNSLVHIKTGEEIRTLISNMYDSLENNGSIIIQIINYDRILRYNIKSLPTIDRKDKGIKFIREYKYSKEETLIDFQTELLILKDGVLEKYENSVPLLPIKSKEIIDIIKKVGFSKIDLYGSFLMEKFTQDSYALVIKAFK